MKRHLTTTAGALLVCAVALGGCGEQEEPKPETLGYGNYEPGGQQEKSPQTESLGHDNYQPGAQDQSPEQQGESLPSRGHITTDHAHVAE